MTDKKHNFLSKWLKPSMTGKDIAGIGHTVLADLSGRLARRITDKHLSITERPSKEAFHEGSIEPQSTYVAEYDTVNPDEWYQILRLFDDGNLYQTIAYERKATPGFGLSHFVLRDEVHIVAAAQVCLVSVPIMRIGMAYVRWGPMWKRKGENANPEVFALALRSLRTEYVERRHFVLRVFPLLFEDEAEAFVPIFNALGFRKNRWEESQRTLLIDLRRSLEELRRGCRRKWRQQLGYAIRENLEVVEGTGSQLAQDAVEVYREMYDRKRFYHCARMARVVNLQANLPEDMKLRTLVCKSGGGAAAAMMWSAIGSIGLPVLAATGDRGLTSHSSYLLWWRMLEWLKSQGRSHLNVGGISPQRNFGGFVFKTGLAGHDARDVHFLGKFDAFEVTHLLSVLSIVCVKVADFCRVVAGRLSYAGWEMRSQRRKISHSAGEGGGGQNVNSDVLPAVERLNVEPSERSKLTSC